MLEAIVLVGGLGTRLKEVSGDTPKPMVGVGGQPFLYRILKQLELAGVSRIVLACGFQADYLQGKVLEDKPVDCEILFSSESEQLGTGGAIKLASHQIQGKNFLVLNGDSYFDIDLQGFVRFYEEKGVPLSIAGACVEDVSRYGALVIDDNGLVISMNEKGRKGAGVINSGVYCMNKILTNSMPVGKFSFEEVILQAFSIEYFCWKQNSFFIDIGIPKDFHRSQKLFS